MNEVSADLRALAPAKVVKFVVTRRAEVAGSSISVERGDRVAV
jgi:hypothetical protein